MTFDLFHLTSLSGFDILTMVAKTLHADSHSSKLSACNIKTAMQQLCTGRALPHASSPISVKTLGQKSINSCKAWQAAIKTSGLS